MTRFLVVVTDRRKRYLELTLASAKICLIGDFDRKIIMDDSGEEEFHQFLLKNYPDFEVVHNPVNVGRVPTMKHAWEICTAANADFVFHLQNDFMIIDRIRVDLLQEILVARPQLSQIALMRQPWSDIECVAGSVYRKDGLVNYRPFENHGYYWNEYNMRFTDNPALIRGEVLKLPYPSDRNACSEGMFSESVLKAGWSSAYWGRTNDPPTVMHIGYCRHEDYQEG